MAQEIYTGKFLAYRVKGRWEYVERVNCAGVAVIVAVTTQQELVLTEQHRVPLNASVIELPAGLVGDKPKFKGESFESAARRELLEETGFEAEDMTTLIEGPVSSGLTSEIVTFFLAKNLTKRHAGGGDEKENIRVHIIPTSRVDAWLEDQEKRGVWVDPKVYTGLYMLKKLAAR